MTMGLPVTKAQLDNDFGATALGLRRSLNRIEELHHYLVITPDATLIALGYTAGQVATIKSAFSDGDTINNLATGNATLAVATNLMANLDQLAGDLLTS